MSMESQEISQETHVVLLFDYVLNISLTPEVKLVLPFFCLCLKVASDFVVVSKTIVLRKKALKFFC